MTVHRAIVQIRRPSPGDPGQVSEGYYVIEGNTLVMTHPDGEPISADQFRHQLNPGDDARAIAGVLTKLVRRQLLGISGEQEAFGRRLSYADQGIA